MIFSTKILDIPEGVMSAKNDMAGGAGGQSDRQFPLFSSLADSQSPLLLQLQSNGQLLRVSLFHKSHLPFGQVEETVTPIFTESVAAKT